MAQLAGESDGVTTAARGPCWHAVARWGRISTCLSQRPEPLPGQCAYPHPKLARRLTRALSATSPARHSRHAVSPDASARRCSTQPPARERSVCRGGRPVGTRVSGRACGISASEASSYVTGQVIGVDGALKIERTWTVPRYLKEEVKRALVESLRCRYPWTRSRTACRFRLKVSDSTRVDVWSSSVDGTAIRGVDYDDGGGGGTSASSRSVDTAQTSSVLACQKEGDEPFHRGSVRLVHVCGVVALSRYQLVSFRRESAKPPGGCRYARAAAFARRSLSWYGLPNITLIWSTSPMRPP